MSQIVSAADRPAPDDRVFDVFLCHHGSDKPQVKKIATLLEKSGLRPWLDESQLPPGATWQDRLEGEILRSRSMAVFFGPSGLGDWQQMEIQTFRTAFQGSERPIIPVILGNGDESGIPFMLRNLTWVDFRKDDPDPFEQLRWGITQQKTKVQVENLRELKEVLNEPRVQRILSAVRSEFVTRCEQVRRLGILKNLHDELHKMQFKCYQPLVAEIKQAEGFPDDEFVLDDCELQLGDVIDRIKRRIGRDESFETDDSWIGYLEEARTHLRAAIDETDPKRLNRAVKRLRQVRDSQMYKINARLKNVAEEIDIGPIVKELRSVATNLESAGFRPERVDKFNAGVETLDELTRGLFDLVRLHDNWQDVDRRLYLIEATLDEDTEDLELLLQDLKEQEARLFRGNEDDRASQFWKLGAGLGQAIEQQNNSQLTKYFARFQTCIGLQFDRVDQDLKETCDRLREVGDEVLGEVATAS